MRNDNLEVQQAITYLITQTLTNGAVSPNFHLSLGKQNRVGPESEHRADTLRPPRVAHPVHLLASYQFLESYHTTNLKGGPVQFGQLAPGK